MKVCICGGTNPGTNPKWLNFAEDFGQRLCDNNIDMVWGGNAHGVLSHIHAKYQQNQKKNTLVLPRTYEKDLESMEMEKTDKVIKANRVSERTQKMYSLADVVVFLPGGVGTLYEFWSALEYKRACEFNIDIILFNHKNFFKHQLAHLDFIEENGFTKVGNGGAPYTMELADLFTVATTTEEVITKLVAIRNEKTERSGVN